MKSPHRFLPPFLLLISALPSHAGEIHLGILPRLPAEELIVMFTPLAEYLSQETGETVTLVLPKDYPDFMESARKGEMEMGLSNPLVYLRLHKERNAEPLALAAEEDKTCMFRGVLLIREDAGIEKVADLQGKRLIFTDCDSCGGYLSQLLFLHRQGIMPGENTEVLPFAGRFDRVVQALVEGKADAGGIREDDLARARTLEGFSRLKVLTPTDYLPSWAAWVDSGLAQDLRERITDALMRLPRKDPVLKAACFSGFTPVSDLDFDNLRQAAEQAGAF